MQLALPDGLEGVRDAPEGAEDEEHGYVGGGIVDGYGSVGHEYA